MTSIWIYKCTESFWIDKVGSFTEGKEYQVKRTKKGDKLVALSDEGVWTVIFILGYTYNRYIYKFEGMKEYLWQYYRP